MSLTNCQRCRLNNKDDDDEVSSTQSLQAGVKQREKKSAAYSLRRRFRKQERERIFPGYTRFILLLASCLGLGVSENWFLCGLDALSIDEQRPQCLWMLKRTLI